MPRQPQGRQPQGRQPQGRQPQGRQPQGRQPQSPEPGPERLGEILSRLFTARGWGRRQARLHLEKAWETAVGPLLGEQTRLASITRGIVEIEVASAVVLQELAHFQKRKLLEKLRELLPTTTLKDLRFRAGSWSSEG